MQAWVSENHRERHPLMQGRRHRSTLCHQPQYPLRGGLSPSAKSWWPELGMTRQLALTISVPHCRYPHPGHRRARGRDLQLSCQIPISHHAVALVGTIPDVRGNLPRPTPKAVAEDSRFRPCDTWQAIFAIRKGGRCGSSATSAPRSHAKIL